MPAGRWRGPGGRFYGTLTGNSYRQFSGRRFSVGRLQGAAIANFLADVYVGRLQGAASANYLADISVGRLQGAAIANFCSRSFCGSVTGRS